MKQLILISISAALVNNIVLGQFLGLGTFFKQSGKVKDAAEIGVVMMISMTVSAFVNSLIYQLILLPLQITYLKTLVFMLVVAGMATLVMFFLKTISPRWQEKFQVFMPMILVNSGILGVGFSSVRKDYGILHSTVYGFGSGAGFLIAIVILAGLREKIKENDAIPEAFQGLPVLLLTAGLMAMVFSGFAAFL